MNKKLLSIFLIVGVAGLFLTVNALSGDATCTEVPDEIVIDNEAYERNIKEPVPLSHKKHSEDYGVACDQCHHAYKDGKNVWKEGDPVQKCSECHDPAEKKDGAYKLQNAYHNNCRNCHKKLKQEGKATGPMIKCNDCHIQESK